MPDGTSVGKVYLDLEISKSSISKELQGLAKSVNSSLSSTISGMNNFMKNTFSRFGSSGKSANEQVSKSASTVNAKYEKTKEKIAQVNGELAKLYAQQDAIARNYAEMPAFEGMSKVESVDKMLSGDKQYSELGEQIDKLESKLNGLKANLGQAAGANEQLNDSLKKTDNGAKKAGKSIKIFGDHSKKTGSKVGGLAAVIGKSLMSVLRRLFVYNLILKGIRGIMSYTGSALKTNNQFMSSLNAVQTNLRVAFQPIFDFVLPALNALMSAMATVTTYIATAISALFGKTYKQSYNSAKGIETASKAMKGYGGAAKQAGKDAKGALMSFDEVNNLDLSGSDADGGGGGGNGGFEMEVPDLSTVEMAGIEKFKKLMASIFEPFKKAWEKEGLNTINAAKYALDSLKGVISAIGKSWLEVWTNSSGQLMLETILRIIQNILNTVGNLATAFKNAWETNNVGTRIIQGIFDLLNIILGTIERITKATAEWAKNLNFTPLLESIATLLEALKPLTKSLGDGLVWLWENALLPMASWVIEDAIPVFLEMLAAALKVLNSVIDTFKPLGQWLWDNFLLPIARWTGGIIITVLKGIRNGLLGISNWIDNHKGAVQDMTIVVAGFATAWGLVNTAVKLWHTIGGIGTAVTNSFGDALKFLKSPTGVAVLAIGAVIAVVVLLIKHWDEVKEAGAKAWEWIKEKWTGAGEWFKETVVEPIKTFFTDLWEVIKTKASDAWEGAKGIWKGVSDWFNNRVITPVSNFFGNLRDNIKTALDTAWTWVKNIWNGAGTWFKNIGEDMFNGMWDGLKNVWKSIKSWVRDTVNWLKDKLTFWKSSTDEMSFSSGSGGGGGNPPHIGIPKFARGGIVDQPTLAMIGERGKEAVMPLEDTSFVDKLASALANVLMTALSATGGNTQDASDSVKDAIVNIDGTELARILIPKMDSELQRMGYRGILRTI